MGVPVGRFWYGSRKCEGSGERKSVCVGGGGGATVPHLHIHNPCIIALTPYSQKSLPGATMYSKPYTAHHPSV